MLKWTVKRNGTTVVDTSTLGLRLSNGTTLGTSAVITNYQHWHVSNTWTPTYGRNATVSDTYQEMRWNLRDTVSLINFSVQIRAYATGVAFRYVLLDTGTARLVLDILRDFYANHGRSTIVDESSTRAAVAEVTAE